MISLKKDDYEIIVAQCLRELPDEACGILAGKDGEVKKVFIMANAQKSPENFFMDGKEQLKVTKEIRGLGLEMLGIYHSHVASQAYPSAHDVAMAFYPEVSYVIVSIKDTGNPSIRSFKIVDGRISEEEVRII